MIIMTIQQLFVAGFFFAGNPWPVHAGHSSQPPESQKDAKDANPTISSMVTEENNERTNKVIQFFMAIKKKKTKQTGGASLEFSNHRKIQAGGGFYPLW